MMYEKLVLYTSYPGDIEATFSEVVADEGSAGVSESSALLAEESSAQDATETETTEAVLFEDMTIGNYSTQYCANYAIVLMTVYVIAWTVLQIFKIIEKRRRTNET